MTEKKIIHCAIKIFGIYFLVLAIQSIPQFSANYYRYKEFERKADSLQQSIPDFDAIKDAKVALNIRETKMTLKKYLSGVASSAKWVALNQFIAFLFYILGFMFFTKRSKFILKISGKCLGNEIAT